ncbi:unnamed protein product [Lupinus luteus]|uniref:CLAVATA3/ESR (CLE)-related protein 9 n=1 Tax=Lupinus luteus TaxID=3873 RepID=A0AAV1WT30_LUPLU
MMKSSLSSPTVYASGKVIIITLLAILFIFFVSSVNCRLPSPLLPSPTSSRNNNLQRYYCDSFSKRNLRSLCMQLQRIHSNLQPFPLPPKANGIDPRYGEQKRLVPSGPNPLHN